MAASRSQLSRFRGKSCEQWPRTSAMLTPGECAFGGPDYNAARLLVFRRIVSKVPANVLEIVSTVAIVTTFGVRHGEDLELVFLTDIGKLA